MKNLNLNNLLDCSIENNRLILRQKGADSRFITRISLASFCKVDDKDLPELYSSVLSTDEEGDFVVRPLKPIEAGEFIKELAAIVKLAIENGNNMETSCNDFVKDFESNGKTID